MKTPLYTSSLLDERGAPESHCPVISIFETDGSYEPYLWVTPVAISSTLCKRLQCKEDVACHRMWETGLFRLQHQVLLALVFAPAGIGLGLERGSTSTIQSRMSESVRSMRKYIEIRTVSKPAERGLVNAMYPNMNIKFHLNTSIPWLPR
jgi:hypothetical protein